MRFARITQSSRSRARRLLALAAAPVLLATGCESMSHTDRGVLGGAGLGAVGGALTGAAVGRPAAGAAIGAALGGVGGGLIGNSMDRTEERHARLAQAPAPRGPLGLTDVAAMAQQHVSDDVIVSQIRTTGSVYTLSASDLGWLKTNGVSDRVVMEMQQTGARVPRGVYAPAPVYAVPVYVAEPPPPPVHFGIGFGGRFR